MNFIFEPEKQFCVLRNRRNRRGERLDKVGDWDKSQATRSSPETKTKVEKEVLQPVTQAVNCCELLLGDHLTMYYARASSHKTPS